MPLERCSLPSGKKGWRFGKRGKCYPGKAAAIKQAYAEVGGDENKLKEELSKGEKVTAAELEAALQPDPEPSFGNRFLDAAHAYISQKERDKMPKEDFAGDGTSYPIKDQKHLDLAVRDMGRESPEYQARIKKKIKEIAKRKGLKLPASWVSKKKSD